MANSDAHIMSGKDVRAIKLVEVRHDQSVVENWAKRSQAMSGTAESPRYDYRIAAL